MKTRPYFGFFYDKGSKKALFEKRTQGGDCTPKKINLVDSNKNKNTKSISPLDISKRVIEDLKMCAIKAPNAPKAKIIAGKNTTFFTHTPLDSKDGRGNQNSLKMRKGNNNLRAQGKKSFFALFTNTTLKNTTMGVDRSESNKSFKDSNKKI